MQKELFVSKHELAETSPILFPLRVTLHTALAR